MKIITKDFSLREIVHAWILVGPQCLNVSLGRHQPGLHLSSFIFSQSYLSLGADHFHSLGLQSRLQVAQFVLQLARLLLKQTIL